MSRSTTPDDAVAARLPDGDHSQVDELIDHVNAGHADTVVFLVRHLTEHTDAEAAEIAAVDRDGVEVMVGDPRAALTIRLEFPRRLDTADELYPELLAFLGAARAAAGPEVELTSIEREIAQHATMATFPATVVTNVELTPSLRQIDVVVAHASDGRTFRSLGGDQFVFVFAAGPGGPPIAPDHSMDSWMASPADERSPGAYYTVRSWDPSTSRMTLWFVDHGHDAGMGGWSRRAASGERIAMWGPRLGFSADPTAATHLFVTDETGFAAVAALVDEVDPSSRVVIVAEAIGPEHRVEFGTGRRDVSVTWIDRGPAEAGTGTALVDTVRQVVETERGVDPEGLVAFGAGESRQITAVRKFLRFELGLPADRVSMTGYWRR